MKQPTRFSTAQIVSASTGRLCCQMHGVYEILNFLTGDDLMTHQLPRACRACEPSLRQQFPWLAQVNPETCTTDNWREWIAEIEDRFGKEHLLTPCPELWQHRDPIVELKEMTGGKKPIIAAILTPTNSNQDVALPS